MVKHLAPNQGTGKARERSIRSSPAKVEVKSSKVYELFEKALP